MILALRKLYFEDLSVGITDFAKYAQPVPNAQEAATL